ncbi:MAG: C39 family peptidase [Clostridia bacterium]
MNRNCGKWRARAGALALIFVLLLSAVPAAYAEKAPQGARAQSGQKVGKNVRYAKKQIKLYEKRDNTSTVLATIPKGTKIKISGAKDGWCKTTYDAKSGFVRTTNLSKKRIGAGATPVPGATPTPGATPVPGATPTPGETPVPGATPSPGATHPPAPSATPGGKLETEVDPDEIITDIGGDVDAGGNDSGMTKLDKRKNKAKNWRGQIVLAEGGMPIPLLFQFDDKRTVCVFNGVKRSVSTSGCSVTCLSMLIAYLTDNTEQSPYTLFREACQKGLYRGKGIGREAVQKIAESYHVPGTWRDLTQEELVAVLKAGKPIIANMGPGYFTDAGHYVVLRGVTEDGLILVNDPNSQKNSQSAFPVALFLEEQRPGCAFFVVDSARPAETPDPDATPAPESTPMAVATLDPAAPIS